MKHDADRSHTEWDRTIEKYKNDMMRYHRAAVSVPVVSAEPPRPPVSMPIPEPIAVPIAKMQTETITPPPSQMEPLTVETIEEEVLPKTIPDTPVYPTEETSCICAGRGKLTVRAATSGGALPLVGALVTVSRVEDGSVLLCAVDETGPDAHTREFTLPGADTSPGTLYNVCVNREEGYTSFDATNVPVYADVLTMVKAEWNDE